MGEPLVMVRTSGRKPASRPDVLFGEIPAQPVILTVTPLSGIVARTIDSPASAPSGHTATSQQANNSFCVYPESGMAHTFAAARLEGSGLSWAGTLSSSRSTTPSVVSPSSFAE